MSPEGASDMPAQATHQSISPTLGTPERRRMAMWLVLSVFAALLAYFGFRGYLTPELLFLFANFHVC
jgi:hypothetical protein